MLYKLLVVDDETETRVSLCNYFPWEELGFQVVAQKENGQQALEYLENNPVDVLLCDIVMPIMDGFELLTLLKEKNISPVIVLLTGMRDFEYTRQAIQLGTVSDYLLKPTKYQDFAEAFQRIKENLDSKTKESASRKQELPEGRNEKIIEKIKQYIETNYRTATLDDVGELVYMNPNYLSQFFKQHYGSNFSDYLLEVKMEKATELLKNINYRIADVSNLVGYSSPKNFTRAFKNYYGVTPKEFRETGGV